MKRLMVVSFCLLMLLIGNTGVKAQFLNNAKKLIPAQAGSFSEGDAAKGIKEALSKGAVEGVKLTSAKDGYLGNTEIKIPFPQEAKTIETKLRSIGLGNKVDELIVSLNRAAEDAAKEAQPIFLAAIRNMTVNDAINIVKGNDDAATRYLDRTTSPELKAKFQPDIKASLDKVNATEQWAYLINAYNKIPMVKKMNPDLPAYVTDKAIEGLFVMIAKEELKIRKDPMARTSEILKKVFGR
jgi:hypothetical protein